MASVDFHNSQIDELITMACLKFFYLGSLRLLQNKVDNRPEDHRPVGRGSGNIVAKIQTVLFEGDPPIHNVSILGRTCVEKIKTMFCVESNEETQRTQATFKSYRTSLKPNAVFDAHVHQLVVTTLTAFPASSYDIHRFVVLVSSLGRLDMGSRPHGCFSGQRHARRWHDEREWLRVELQVEG